MSYKIGASKVDMTYFEPEIGLVGFGKYEHRAVGVATPLYVRTFIIEDSDNNLISISVVELWSATQSLRDYVLKKLQDSYKQDLFNEDNVMISANHTHSAPGGFSYYPFYNFSISGFHEGVLKKFGDSVVESIISAYDNRVQGTVSFHKGTFEPEIPVAYNRAITAYNLNEDVTPKGPADVHLAIDRTMTMLKFADSDNKLLGSINWFGVHTTTVRNINFKICSDNKGYAAKQMEEDYGDGSVHAFAQHTAADVSSRVTSTETKYKPDFDKLKDDFERAKAHGELQFKKAKEILESDPVMELNGTIDSMCIYSDMGNVEIDPELSDGKNLKTGPSCLGVAFFKGTGDGKGVTGIGAFALTSATHIAYHMESTLRIFMSKEKRARINNKRSTQTKKRIFLESTHRRILGLKRISILPKKMNKAVEIMVDHYENGSLNGHPIAPDILPLQMIKIGQFNLIGLPGEVTTVGGKRIKDKISEYLNLGPKDALEIMSYTNMFCGYTTTPEEYRLQGYEGAHTMYGEYTLLGYITEFKKICLELQKEKSKRSYPRIRPPKFEKSLLEKRSYKHKV